MYTPPVRRSLATVLSTALAVLALGLTSTPAQAASTSTWQFSDTTTVIGHTITAEITWAELPPGTGCTTDYIEPASDPAGVEFTIVDEDTLEMTSYTPGTYEVTWLRGGCYSSGPYALPSQTVTFTRATWGLSATSVQVGETITTDITLAGHPYTLCTADLAFPGSNPEGVVFTQADWPNWELTATQPGTYEITWSIGGCHKKEPYSMPPVTVRFLPAAETTWTFEPAQPKAGQVVTATISWAGIPDDQPCAEYYRGFQSSPEGARLIEVVDDHTITFTADQPGTYTVSFGTDSCHLTPDQDITFTATSPLTAIIERLIAILKTLLENLLRSFTTGL
jgi:hypothetical protein